MSNTIWHKRDETPKDFSDVVLANFETGSCSVSLSPFHNVSFDYDKWCYLTDLIAQADKAERLQKAVDVAVERLSLIAHETFQGEPSNINMGFHVRAAAALTDIDEITSLEQKDEK